MEFCPKFEAKICPKSFRPNSSFVKSVPVTVDAAAGVWTAVDDVAVQETCLQT
jgi:hypothetical protein